MALWWFIVVREGSTLCPYVPASGVVSLMSDDDIEESWAEILPPPVPRVGPPPPVMPQPILRLGQRTFHVSALSLHYERGESPVMNLLPGADGRWSIQGFTGPAFNRRIIYWRRSHVWERGEFQDPPLDSFFDPGELEAEIERALVALAETGGRPRLSAEATPLGRIENLPQFPSLVVALSPNHPPVSVEIEEIADPEDSYMGPLGVEDDPPNNYEPSEF